jgi:hypothetical protein
MSGLDVVPKRDFYRTVSTPMLKDLRRKFTADREAALRRRRGAHLTVYDCDVRLELIEEVLAERGVVD